ncbi:MAG: hypothetical protein QY320_02030 [Gammaproteobacteria bacterium]|nr:MAG: hypothetical protein QY320_02030 [Gammaproteobacteria bacterium]
MKPSAVVTALLLALLAGCSGEGDNSGTDPLINLDCPRDNLICPNGTIVMRTGANCEFVCPQDESVQAACDYAAPDRRYFSRYADMCAQIPANCQSGETYFNDACGCGCAQ